MVSPYASNTSSADVTKPSLYFGYTNMDSNQMTMNHHSYYIIVSARYAVMTPAFTLLTVLPRDARSASAV